MRRVVVVGTSGSGKTTLAKQIAAKLNLAHIELDALHWEPNWTSTPPERMRQKVVAALASAAQGWTICGNYRVVNDAIWPHADTIVWLDYPMSLVFTRTLVRTLRRWWNGEVLWNGNRERLWTNFCTRDSILLWVINTWRIRRRKYPKDFREPRCAHLRIVRLRSPQQTQRWLAAVARSSDPPVFS
jgi:adenylate kinase family enzyme